MKFRWASKTILTNFNKFVKFIKIWAEVSFWKNIRKFQEKFKGNFKNGWKNFQEIFVIRKNLEKMKIYKNFMKQTKKFEKLSRKYYEN